MSENKRNWFTTNIHELVHFTKQNAAKAYERLENHIIDWFLSENNLGGYESAVEAYMRTYSKSNPNFTRADAKEEITADSIAALFSTKDGAKSFVHYIADTYKQKSKEIFDTFEEWINNIITSINTMLKKDVLSPLQRTVLQMDKKQAMSIRKEFLSALDEAIKNYASSKTEQKNNTADSSAKFSVNPNFKSQYDKWDKKNPRTAFILGSTSNALQSIGIRNADITIDAAKLIKIRNKHSEMTDAVIKQIPSIIENPIVVMSSKSMNSRLTMFGQVIKDGKPVLVVLELFPKNKNTINLNEIKVASAYGKKNAQNFINSSNILYIDSNNKRVKNWEKRTGLQLPVGNSSLNSTNNIPNSSDNVNNNVKNSLDVDIEEYFDDEFYDRFKYEDKRKITKSIEQLEKECDELWNLAENNNSYLDEFYTSKYQLKALKAGFNNVHDYVVEDSKKRVRKYPEQYIPEIIKKREKIKKEQELLHDIQQSPSHKVAQFKIIQANNPAPEGSNYVWIRRPSDIKTLAEAIEDSESFSWGDFTRKDAIKALKRDLITVYSSYPIKQGVFVSTSYIQAQEYAGGEGGRVYSKRIKPSRVAWINGDEGQYASVKNSLDVDSEDTNNPTDSTDIRYSLNVNAEVDVDKALNDKYYNQDIVLTDTTPSIVASQKGVNNYPMLMKASHIRENIFTRDEAKNKGYNTGKNINYHGLGKELFLNIISDLDKVQRAYRGTKNAENPSRRENYFLLISQYTDNDGKTINVPVYINEKGKYNRVFIDTNKLATVFGRDDFESYIKRELSKGNLVRIKNRSNQVSEATLAISADYNKITSKDSISNSNKNVNTKLSKDVNFTQSELESLKDENSTLRSENMYLATINEELKTGFKLTGGRVINPRLAKVVAQRIKETWNTTLSSDDIAEMVRQISVRHQNDADFNWNVLLAECKAIAQDVWDNRKNEITAEGKEILAEIRKTKVSLDYIQKSKIANYYGSYDVFRKKNFGNLRISNDGVPLNVKWMEWSEKYPDLFNPETTEAQQPIELEEIIGSLKTAYDIDYGFLVALDKNLSHFSYKPKWDFSISSIFTTIIQH